MLPSSGSLVCECEPPELQFGTKPSLLLDLITWMRLDVAASRAPSTPAMKESSMLSQSKVTYAQS